MPNAVDMAIFNSGDPAQMKARLKAIFVNRGVTIPMGNESEDQRLSRMVASWLADPTYVDKARTSVDDIKVGKTPQAPYSPLGPTTPPDTTGVQDAVTERQNRDALAAVKTNLTRYGLPPALADWAWQQLVAGSSESEVMLALRDRSEFKTRFKAIGRAEELGLPAISPAQILEFETQARADLKRLGAPEGFYDSPDDFVELIVAGWSPLEVRDAANEAIVRIGAAPQEVKDFYTEAFGVDAGTSALLALYLDQSKAAPVLDRMATTAEIGGAGHRFGADLDLTRAGELAAIGVNAQQAQAGFRDLDEKGALFNETVSEGTDLTMEGEGVDAIFGLGEGGARKIEQRRQRRVADLGGSTGALVTEKGVRGVGIADR
jgi:hypothetical protein